MRPPGIEISGRRERGNNNERLGKAYFHDVCGNKGKGKSKPGDSTQSWKDQDYLAHKYRKRKKIILYMYVHAHRLARARARTSTSTSTSTRTSTRTRADKIDHCATMATMIMTVLYSPSIIDYRKKCWWTFH
jgi:hypothetical protein